LGRTYTRRCHYPLRCLKSLPYIVLPLRIGYDEPHFRDDNVSPDALAEVVHRAELELRIWMPLVSSSTKPFGGFFLVLRCFNSNEVSKTK
jgi:hypothetical protein